MGLDRSKTRQKLYGYRRGPTWEALSQGRANESDDAVVPGNMEISVL